MRAAANTFKRLEGSDVTEWQKVYLPGVKRQMTSIILVNTHRLTLAYTYIHGTSIKPLVRMGDVLTGNDERKRSTGCEEELK